MIIPYKDSISLSEVCLLIKNNNMSRTSNSIKMVIASTLCQVVVLVCGLILPPLLISQYGSEVNGLLNLVKQLMSYFGIVCLGLGVSAQVALYKPIADNDWKAINAILAAAKHFYNVSGALFAGLIFLSSAIVPFVVDSTIPTLDIVLVILITGIGSISEYVVISKYKVFLSANQKQYINSRITAEGILLNTIVSVLLIKCNCSIIIIQLGSSIVYVLRLLYTIRYVKKNYPLISFSAEKPFLETMQNRWSAFSYQLSHMIINLSPMIIVSIAASLSDASVFSVYFMVFSSLAMVAGIFSSGLQAPFGDILAKDETETLKNAFSSFEFLYTLVLSICFCCGMLLMITFVGSYIHNDDGVDYIRHWFSFFMCISFFVTNFRIPFTTLVEAKGLFKVNNKYNLWEAIAFIASAIPMVYYWGIIGIAVAGVATGLPRTLHYIIYCRRNFGEAVNVFKLLLKLVLTTVLSSCLYFLLQPSAEDNVFMWFIYVLPYVLIAIICVTVLHIAIDYRAFRFVLKRFAEYHK